MAVEYDPNGIPILSGESMLSDVPQYTQELAPKLVALDDKIDSAGGPTVVGPLTWSPGTFNVGTHNLTGHAFNGKVGDVWSGQFVIGYVGSGAVGSVTGKLSLASGISLSSPTSGGLSFVGSTSTNVICVAFSWKAVTANDYLIVNIYSNGGGTSDSHIQATAINFGGGVTTTLRERAEMFKERLETPTAGTADQKFEYEKEQDA